MKNIILFSFIVPLFAHAQTDNSLLWKVTDKHSENISYLFGTIHTNDSTLNTFDDTWWNAFKSCEVFAGEVNFSDPNELMASLAVSMMKDNTLKDLYTEEEFVRVQALLSSRLDPMSAMMVAKMKPFYIMAALMEMPSDKGPYKEIMDMRLQNIAKENGKQIVGLESTTEQAASIDVISVQEQAKLLLDYVDNGSEMNTEMEMMEKFYLMQNLDSLASMEEQFEVPAEFMESILDGRNDRFVQKLIPHLKDASVFCGVGALHLPGKTGLIEQLRMHGFKLEPVLFRFE